MQVNAVVGADSTAVRQTANEVQKTEKNFSEYMKQADGGSLEQIFQQAADTYHVSKDLLLAMAKAESGFNAQATSRSGAMGIMQLMPATAASLGVTDAYDPQQNIMGGAKYISQLLEKYNGNVSYAVAAYNAGSGNVDKYGGIPPFSETQNYVAKVLSYLEEGVTIPDGADTSAGTSAAAKTQGSTDSTLGGLMNQYFDYDDYLEFLQLFTRIISEKLNGTDAAAQTDSNASDNSATETADEAAQPSRRLQMTVRDSFGHVNTYRQDGQSAVTQESDAYAAYKNMTAGGRSSISVFLKPSGE